ncbi:MAG: cytochrome c biogenesis protein ResB [Deltaproteobacteria bacterium]|nr:cytochrome c biogenesis protein ResB [Deltaproteobacteria bacterium]
MQESLKKRFFNLPPNVCTGGWLYKKLSSLTTSIYVLGLMAVFFVIGTIFPQGESFSEYVKSGGGFTFFVENLGLLDLFVTPVFLILSAVLLINLAVCVYDRYAPLFAKRVFQRGFSPDKTIYLTHGIAGAHVEVRRVLKEDLGFKLIFKDSEWIIMEKGLPMRLLTWAYHAGLLLCFFGLVLTYLFAFEDTMTLSPGKLQPISMKEPGRVQSLWKSSHTDRSFGLSLDEFSAEYVQAPRLDYPKDKLSRLAMGLGWKGREVALELKDDSIAPKNWRSRVRVIKDGVFAEAHTIEINDPLRFEGYTFYQTGYEQKLKVRVDASPILLETKTGEEIFLPGIENPLKFGDLKTGALYRLDGSVDRLIPFTTVKQARDANGPKDKRSYDDLGRLEQDGSITVDGRRITLAGIEESAVLSVRRDPGVNLLWTGGFITLIAMALRFYGGFYTAAYRVMEADGITLLEVCLSTKGLWTNRESILRRLEYSLTRDDLKLTPLPDDAG